MNHRYVFISKLSFPARMYMEFFLLFFFKCLIVLCHDGFIAGEEVIFGQLLFLDRHPLTPSSVSVAHTPPLLHDQHCAGRDLTPGSLVCSSDLRASLNPHHAALITVMSQCTLKEVAQVPWLCSGLLVSGILCPSIPV